MSERIVSDPSQHGWIEVNGKWMWGASGGSGGSIQDGDTEGQITTWDGTEWTPEGAVVVSNGTLTASHSSAAGIRVATDDDTDASLELYNSTGAFTARTASDHSFRIRDTIAQPTSERDRLVIDADGNVNITGKLFVNGQEVTGGGGDSFWVEESPGVIKYNGTAKATDLVAG